MVTVIIPTYKRANYICRAIDSVLSQTYTDIEIIVVDDNDKESNDRIKMEEIMKKYSNNSKIKYIKHEKNMNGSAARNTGIKNSSGDYITFLDDDDFFLKNRIENLVNLLENTSEYDGAYTGLIKIENGKIRGIYSAELEGDLEEKMLNLYSFFRTGSNIFLRKKVFEKLNGFDTDFKRHQDVEFMCRFFEFFKIKALNEFSVVKDDSSRINQPNIEKSIEAKELFFKKFSDKLKKYNENTIKINIYQSVLNQCKKKSIEYDDIILKMRNLGCSNPRKNIISNSIFLNIKKFVNCILVLLKSLKCKKEIREMNDIMNCYKRSDL